MRAQSDSALFLKDLKVTRPTHYRGLTGHRSGYMALGRLNGFPIKTRVHEGVYCLSDAGSAAAAGVEGAPGVEGAAAAFRMPHHVIVRPAPFSFVMLSSSNVFTRPDSGTSAPLLSSW